MEKVPKVAYREAALCDEANTNRTAIKLGHAALSSRPSRGILGGHGDLSPLSPRDTQFVKISDYLLNRFANIYSGQTVCDVPEASSSS